ncbi:Malate/lactate/ureidoglycolate dehydrogenase, LDH2 family [Modicisalibacter ilicicola DSM 19980]|uniref:Malate/lactate/ureidoglycolate dehydrogenase, LDH2 family n=1 Tax=Modicisalibacter ilicicola DSM 19980 TaxID=1121942 RepID=A0A1M4ZNW0_9GAMM|nr:Ldh family oxidoreductase [Halomonas ilicicola]SHF19688.1 Malate/lactate/ureidoglycolate dehydrogenase, LDH2 family [Halomonas ilicicola DSM 19980]
MTSTQYVPQRVAVKELERFIDETLLHCGTDEASATAVTRALVTASRMGTDSHGLRLLPHYVKALEGGRIKARPAMAFTRRMPATGHLDADDGFGHLAGYTAIEHAVDMAREVGIGAVAVGNSSHFGAAGCYALAASEEGMIGMAMCNSDPFVLLHGSQVPFHGTNPIAFSVPVEGRSPYLLDMATSSIPWNRVQQYGAIGRTLPPDVAADAGGRLTIEPDDVAALLPLGGAQFGFKGAGLAGVVEILSSTLSGMLNGFRLLPMGGPDMSTPRGIGHFFLVVQPQAFTDWVTFQRGLKEYLEDLGSRPALADREVLAPGDREWRCQAERDAEGIPMDSANWEAYERLAKEVGIAPLREC